MGILALPSFPYTIRYCGSYSTVYWTYTLSYNVFLNEQLILLIYSIPVSSACSVLWSTETLLCYCLSVPTLLESRFRLLLSGVPDYISLGNGVVTSRSVSTFKLLLSVLDLLFLSWLYSFYITFSIFASCSSSFWFLGDEGIYSVSCYSSYKSI